MVQKRSCYNYFPFESNPNLERFECIGHRRKKISISSHGMGTFSLSCKCFSRFKHVLWLAIFGCKRSLSIKKPRNKALGTLLKSDNNARHEGANFGDLMA